MASDPGRPTKPRFNSLAIASAVLAILWIYCVGSLLAIVLGRIAARQITRSDQRGDALAGFGIVVGLLGLLIGGLYLQRQFTHWPSLDG